MRLAVLPLINLHPDGEREIYTDGLTEELIAGLGALDPERLVVIARTSAMTHKGTDKGIPEIGRELGVDYVFYSVFQNLEQALEHFQQAVELDPSYAPAHVGMSKTLAVLGYTHRREPLAVWKPAREAADRALELDGDLAEAWVARAPVPK